MVEQASVPAPQEKTRSTKGAGTEACSTKMREGRVKRVGAAIQRRPFGQLEKLLANAIDFKKNG